MSRLLWSGYSSGCRRDGGMVYWFLAGLREDGGFWGYVRYRLTRQQENRPFSGDLDKDVLARIADLVRESDQRSPEGTPARFDACHTLVGTSTRSPFRRVFGLQSEALNSVVPRSPAMFTAFVDLLQRTMVDAVARCYDDCERDQ
jgi:hypothetical protein